MGDLLEVYTNGAYPATRHRVVIPEEEVVRRQPRQSFVLFLQPDAERVARPLKGLFISYMYDVSKNFGFFFVPKFEVHAV